MTSDVGLIGLAVMGRNLVLNMADHGHQVAVFNRTSSKTDSFLQYCRANEPSAERIKGFKQLKSFVNHLKRPRRIILLVQSTAILPHERDAVDDTIAKLIPLLDKGDIIVDGGNSHWQATNRREETLKTKGIEFLGSGVSGGEIGARFGPSLMPSGSKKAWKSIKPIWTAIAAKVDQRGKPIETDQPGVPIKVGEACTDYIGPNGSGHYVKMVHNGIEYIDMQLICEAYALMRYLLNIQPSEQSKVFKQWNRGALNSFLIGNHR